MQYSFKCSFYICIDDYYISFSEHSLHAEYPVLGRGS